MGGLARPSREFWLDPASTTPEVETRAATDAPSPTAFAYMHASPSRLQIDDLADGGVVYDDRSAQYIPDSAACDASASEESQKGAPQMLRLLSDAEALLAGA